MSEDIYLPDDLFGPGLDTLLIIGNGFDLDLGLNTRYADFAKSEFWPFKDRCPMSSSLGAYLNRHSKDSWFDLENSMAKFSSSKRFSLAPWTHRNSFVQQVKEDDICLVSKLQEYLSIAENGKLNEESIAATILRKISDCLVPATIYSFNYTSLESIGKRLGTEYGFRTLHVHGTLKNKDAILGFNESPKIALPLSFMCKSRRPKYASTSLFDAMPRYKNIIIFGLSLGEIDYGYFKDFFDGVHKGKYNEKHIRIITYDENSRQHILSNIQKMTGNIFDFGKYVNFKVIKTNDKSDEAEFEELYNLLDPKWEVDFGM